MVISKITVGINEKEYDNFLNLVFLTLALQLSHIHQNLIIKIEYNLIGDRI